MTYEYKLLKSSVFCWKLPVMRRRAGEKWGRWTPLSLFPILACEPQVLMALLRCQRFTFIVDFDTKRAIAPTKWEHSRATEISGPFADAFCRRYWNAYFLNMSFLYFLEQFSGCCATPLLSEFGEDQYFILKIFSRFASASTLNSLQQNSSTQFFLFSI